MNVVQTRPAAFDAIAAHYDDLFTNSVIGRAQRDSVWEVIGQHLEPGCSVLELNCGTGEDALFLAKREMSVVACDISEKMVEIAKSRASAEDAEAKVRFLTLAIEDVARLRPGKFDAVLSNFSGLNCVADLHQAATDLAHLLKPGSSAVLCFSNKFCVWEVVWYLLRGDCRRAFRRWTPKPITARIGTERLLVRYPTVAEIATCFAPYFRVRNVYGAGIMVPPSYVEGWMRRLPRAMGTLRRVDRFIKNWPLFRVLGDHVVLVLERTSE